MMYCIIQHIWETASSSCMQYISVPPPGASILSRPLEDGEMPTTGCSGTSVTVPGTTILSQLLEDREMPIVSCRPQVYLTHSQPFALAHWRTERCPPLAAAKDVSLSQLPLHFTPNHYNYTIWLIECCIYH
jgi:hypothetical protein